MRCILETVFIPTGDLPFAPVIRLAIFVSESQPGFPKTQFKNIHFAIHLYSLEVKIRFHRDLRSVKMFLKRWRV